MGEEGENSQSVAEKVKESEKGKEVVVALDTPQRTKNSQLATSSAKFEDSPVFNFLNSLSPIEPVKSVRIAHAINPLNFASIPSVFTSPHVSSLKGSTFLRRHQIPDPSKPEFSIDGGNATSTNDPTTDAANKSVENLKKEGSIDEAVCQPSHECSKLEVELDRSFVRDSSGSHSGITSCDLGSKDSTVYAYTSSMFAPFTQEASQRGSCRMGENEDCENQDDHDKEATGCDWESFISSGADLCIFESPVNTEPCKKSVESGTNFYPDASNNTQNMYSFGASDSGKEVGNGSAREDSYIQPGEGSGLEDIAENQDSAVGGSLNNPTENTNTEHVSGLHRGVRRRCLVYEMAGALRKHLDENAVSDSLLLMQPDDSTSSGDEQLIPATAKDRSDSSRCVIGGIGLHLNALATTPNDSKFVAKFSTPTQREEVTLSEREINTVEDDTPASAYETNEVITQSSPKRKRSKLEQAGEGESCKRCNCKKSKCLKLYCECFAAGLYCVEPCSCIDCFNKPVHEDTVLATRKQIESRNPLAFAPKVIRSSDSLCDTQSDSSKTPASARHKRGCNCKKSGCLKKYCECYQGGVGCSINCRCEGCKNAFGRKDGSSIVEAEAELEEDQDGVTERSTVDKSSKKAANRNKQEQKNPDSALPATPLQCPRSSVQKPVSLKNKLLGSSFPSIGSSFGMTGFLVAQPKFKTHFKTILEDETPIFLQEGSPNSGVKSSSPNSKRVSPHHRGLGTSPVVNSRKLILQSIPSFPSLTPKD